MDILVARSAGLFGKRIDIGDAFGVKPDDVYVVLREPTQRELGLLSNNSPEAISNGFAKILPDLIADHNLTKDGARAPNKDVAAIIIDRGITLFIKVMTEWQKSLPLVQQSPPS